MKSKLEKFSGFFLFSFGVFLIFLGSAELVIAQINPPLPGNPDVALNIDGTVYSFKSLGAGVCAILALVEGSYGALLTTAAGVIAVAAAVMGKHGFGYNIMAVAVGCFILRSLISLFFGSYGCGGEGEGFQGVKYYIDSQGGGIPTPANPFDTDGDGGLTDPDGAFNPQNNTPEPAQPTP